VVTNASSPCGSKQTASNYFSGGILMIIVGIDVAEDKHDCFTISSESKVLFDVFTIPNTLDGFHVLLSKMSRPFPF
jgi:hypothetical protein